MIRMGKSNCYIQVIATYLYQSIRRVKGVQCVFVYNGNSLDPVDIVFVRRLAFAIWTVS